MLSILKKLSAIITNRTNNVRADDLARKQVLSIKAKRFLPSLSQFKHLPRFLNKTEKRLASIAALLAITALFGLGYQFMSKHETRIAANGGTYTEGLIGYPSLINPLYANLSDVNSDLASLIFSGLMRFDTKNNQIVTDLAESYTISEDGKVYTFKLKNGALFHNGDPVTASDIAFTIAAIQNPEYGSPLLETFKNVTVETPDEQTVIFTLSESFAPFLSFLTIGTLPSQIWSNIPPSSAQLSQLNIKPIGSGPYQFKKLSKDTKGTLKSLTLKKNENYYGKIPYIKELTFKFSNSAEELVSLLKNKNIEGAVTVPLKEVSKLSNDRNVKLYHAVLPQYTAAFFNTENSLLKNEEVRRALNIGIDRQTLINNIFEGRANALTGPFFSGTPGGIPPENIPGADLASAASALDTVGFKIPENGGTRMKGDQSLALSLSYANTPELSMVAEELKKQWEALGFSINLHAVSRIELQDSILKTRDFDILLAGELYGYFKDPYPYWHSSQGVFPGLNITKFADRDADNAITAIRTTQNEEKRNSAYIELAQILDKEIPAAFLYQPTYTYAVKNSIKGINLPTVNIPSDRFSYIVNWYIKTKPSFE